MFSNRTPRVFHFGSKTVHALSGRSLILLNVSDDVLLRLIVRDNQDIAGAIGKAGISRGNLPVLCRSLTRRDAPAQLGGLHVQRRAALRRKRPRESAMAALCRSG